MNQLVLIVICLLSAKPPANALERYVIPDARFSALTVTLGATGVWNDTSIGRDYLSIPLNAGYGLLRSGERLNVEGAAGLEFLGQSASRMYLTPDTMQMSWSADSGTAGMSVRADLYPFELPFAGSGYLSASEEVHFSEQRTDTNLESTLDAIRRERVYGDRLNVSVLVGPAFGRIREARTAVIALRIAELLVEEQVLNRPVEDEDVLALAQVLATDRGFVLEHDRPVKGFYSAIEELLVSRGVITPTITARTWFRIREAVESDFGSGARLPRDGLVSSLLQSRPAGIRLSLRGGLNYRGEYWRTEVVDSSLSREDSRRLVPRAQALAEYGKPLTTRLQLTANAAYTVDREGAGISQNVSAGVAGSYQALDWLSVSLTYGGSYTPQTLDSVVGDRHRIQQEAGARVYWYLEDRLRFDAGVLLQDTRSRSDAGRWNWRMELRPQAGFEYRLR